MNVYLCGQIVTMKKMNDIKLWCTLYIKRHFVVLVKMWQSRKKVYLPFFTSLGLVAAIAIQGVWLNNTYILIEENLRKESSEAIAEAVRKEASIRFATTPKGTSIDGSSKNDTVPENTFFYEGITNLGYPMNMDTVDSIASVLLKEYGIEDDFVVCEVKLRSRELLRQSKILNFSRDTIRSKAVPVRTDLSEGVELILVNPYRVFFERMGLLMIASFIMLVLVIGCIVYQIKVIIYQKKVAKLREDFSYAMIHDMKTPLSSIMMCSDALNDDKIENMPELKKSFLGVVRSETVHLLKLINKLLTISKLESHKLTMVKEKVQLEPMLGRIRETFKAKSTKPLYFTLNLQAREVDADKEYLEEAVYNLVDNAVKYSKDEGEVEVEITSECSGGYSCIKVRDNGIGFSEEDKRKIFDKFERGSAIKSSRLGKVAGFGLGLNYVYQVMEAHGGTVTASSVVGKFSEFTLYMPALEEEDTENKE